MQSGTIFSIIAWVAPPTACDVCNVCNCLNVNILITPLKPGITYKL